jgi:ATP phosphoribosyltransferase regulatory subunit HisZ
VSALVELARFDRPYQADLARMFLESHGLEAVVFDTNSYIYSEGALVGVRLMVLDEDLAEARKALQSYKS